MLDQYSPICRTLSDSIALVQAQKPRSVLRPSTRELLKFLRKQRVLLGVDFKQVGMTSYRRLALASVIRRARASALLCEMARRAAG